MRRDPDILTTTTNRNLFQPTKANKARRRSELRDSIQKGKRGSRSRSRDRTTGVGSRLEGSKLAHKDARSSSSRSDRSQLVDLVVEDREAEETERVRARKEGGAKWNEDETKHFVYVWSFITTFRHLLTRFIRRTYGDAEVLEGEDIREGFEPADVPSGEPPEFAIGEDEESDEETNRNKQPSYYGVADEENIWNSPGRR